MNYALSQIVEHEMIVRQSAVPDTGEEVVAQWGFGLLPKVNSPTEIEIYISAMMTPGPPEDNRSMVEVAVSYIFQLSDATPLYPFTEDRTISEEQKMELATLIGVSVGTLRGLTYARTAPILGGTLIMPVLNPLEMLEHFLGAVEGG